MTATQRKARLVVILARSAFGLGVAVSLTGNVVASDHSAVGIGIAIWIPLVFLITLACFEHIPVKGTVGVVRKIGLGFIVFIAGYASYGHLVTVAEMGGADWLMAHALPITVDVMMGLVAPAMRRKAAPAPRTRRKSTTANVTPIKARRSA